MKQSKKSSKKGLLASYKARQTKGNIANTGLKTLVDLVLGATVGAGIGASTGRAAVPVGILLIAGSHYFDEQTGVLRVIGASTVAYGIGKAIENQLIAKSNTVSGFLGEADKAKTRLSQFKDELMAAYYLDKVFKKKEAKSDASGEIGSIDMSLLDVFDQDNHSQAVQYEIGAGDDQFQGAYSSDQFDYAIFDQDDLSTI